MQMFDRKINICQLLQISINFLQISTVIQFDVNKTHAVKPTFENYMLVTTRATRNPLRQNFLSAIWTSEFRDFCNTSKFRLKFYQRVFLFYKHIAAVTKLRQIFNDSVINFQNSAIEFRGVPNFALNFLKFFLYQILKFREKFFNFTQMLWISAIFAEVYLKKKFCGITDFAWP